MDTGSGWRREWLLEPAADSDGKGDDYKMHRVHEASLHPPLQKTHAWLSSSSNLLPLRLGA
jgi:hypothetical protein